MIRRPPRSTLFPTRRSSDLGGDVLPSRGYPRLSARDVCGTVRPHRSEEHTSELQSRLQLVCRLLLEKKCVPQPPPAASGSLSPEPLVPTLPEPISILFFFY